MYKIIREIGLLALENAVGSYAKNIFTEGHRYIPLATQGEVALLSSEALGNLIPGLDEVLGFNLMDIDFMKNPGLASDVLRVAHVALSMDHEIDPLDVLGLAQIDYEGELLGGEIYRDYAIDAFTSLAFQPTEFVELGGKDFFVIPGMNRPVLREEDGDDTSLWSELGRAKKRLLAAAGQEKLDDEEVDEARYLMASAITSQYREDSSDFGELQFWAHSSSCADSLCEDALGVYFLEVLRPHPADTILSFGTDFFRPAALYQLCCDVVSEHEWDNCATTVNRLFGVATSDWINNSVLSVRLRQMAERTINVLTDKDLGKLDFYSFYSSMKEDLVLLRFAIRQLPDRLRAIDRHTVESYYGDLAYEGSGFKIDLDEGTLGNLSNPVVQEVEKLEYAIDSALDGAADYLNSLGGD